jgi:hypothetical protein
MAVYYIYCQFIDFITLCDNLFAAQQGSEMNHIFSEALGKYAVNENRMLRYADRRGKKESLNGYLNKVSIYRQ